MFEVIGNEVFRVTEIKTDTQIAVERINIGYVNKIILQSDKKAILPDSVDKAVITARIYNYLDELQSNYSGIVTYSIDGNTVEKRIVNGVAENLEFTSEVTGKFIIKAYIPEFTSDSVEVEVI
jgi:hypothetical protein